MLARPDHYLDITSYACPITFVRTKLLIERMESGEIAEVRLMGEEPLANVPRSIIEQGHAVLSLEPEDQSADGIYILRLRKS